MNKSLLLGEGALRQPTRRYAGIWVGAVTVCVAASVLFCELHFTAAPVEQTVMTAAVMILSCFMMYTSLFEAGHERACEGELYRKRAAAYEEARERVEARGEGLDAFCTHYAEEELRRVRGRVLFSAGVDTVIFDAYLDGTLARTELRALPRQKRRALRRASRLSPLDICAARLLSADGHTPRGGLVSPARRRVRRTLCALRPTVVGSLVTVAVSPEGIPMTPEAIAAALLRLFTVVWTGVRGYSAGALAVREDDCASLEGKTNLLLAYLAED